MRILFASAVAIGVLVAGCSSGDQAGSSRADSSRTGQWGGQAANQVSVRASVVTQRPISTFILANTTLESVRSVNVVSRLAAQVSQLRVEEGDRVRAGQAMALLDDREIRNDLRQAEIAVRQAQVQLEQAEVQSRLSAANFERAATLFDQQLTSRQEYDHATLTSRTDELAHDNARRALEAAQARLEAIEIQLEYTQIVSPIDGVVTHRMIEKGDRATVNQELFIVEEFPPLWARIHVPEKDLGRIRLGQEVQLRFDSVGGGVFTGTVKMISPVIDSSSGTARITVELPRPGGVLRPGMFGTVAIATETRADAAVIMRKAVVRERDQNYVFVVREDDTAERRPVVLGFNEDPFVEVLEGLRPGEVVVTVGNESLSDGYGVNILGWEGPEAEAGQERRRAAVPGSEDSSRDAASTQDHIAETPARPGMAGGRSAGPGARQGGPEMLERMLQNPEIRRAYEERLKQDPEMANDPEKQRAFFREIFVRMRGDGGSP